MDFLPVNPPTGPYDEKCQPVFSADQNQAHSHKQTYSFVLRLAVADTATGHSTKKYH
jgi:hypothetical protein